MPVEFFTRLQRFESMIWSYARHYELPGVLPSEDLYQEGLIELDRTNQLYPDFDSPLFYSYFKTRLASLFCNLIRYYVEQMRDWRKTVFVSDLEAFLLERKSHEENIEWTGFDYATFSSLDIEPSPEELYEREQRIVEMDRFIHEVRSGLDEEAQWVLDELLKGEVPEQLRSEFQRFPTKMTAPVIALIFGWDRWYALRVIRRIRRRVKTLINRYRAEDTTLLWSMAS